MKLSTLISTVGDENVAFQPLTGSFIRGHLTKHDAEITFATDKGKGQDLITAIATGGQPSQVGLIVWLPRDKLPPELKAL